VSLFVATERARSDSYLPSQAAANAAPAMFRICGGICPPMPLLVNCLSGAFGRTLGVPMGITTPDVRVTLGPVYCLGLCAVAPSPKLDGRMVEPAPTGRPVDGKSAMTLRLYIPIDAAALAAGARQVTSGIPAPS
jgi:hypothetical protein